MDLGVLPWHWPRHLILDLELSLDLDIELEPGLQFKTQMWSWILEIYHDLRNLPWLGHWIYKSEMNLIYILDLVLEVDLQSEQDSEWKYT